MVTPTGIRFDLRDGVTRFTRTAFEEMDTQRTEAIVAQFQKEYAQRGDETSQQVKNIADADITLRVAIDLARPIADQSLYVHDATGAAQDHQMDFVELVGWDGTVISSAQNPSRVGHKEDWDHRHEGLERDPLVLEERRPRGWPGTLSNCGRSVSGGNDKNLYIVGGRRLDQNFLSTLVLPSGMRAFLYVNLDPGFSPAALSSGPKDAVEQPERLQPLIDQIGDSRRRWCKRWIGIPRQPRPKPSTRCLSRGEVTNYSACCWSEARARNWCC